MRFSGFPTNYVPITHVDANGTPIDSEKKHTISQGWLQTYTVLNQIMQGYWQTTSPATVGESHCSFTPWNADIYLEFNENHATVDLTFPAPYAGVLTIYDSNMAIKKSIKVKGDTLTVTSIVAGDTLYGALAPV